MAILKLLYLLLGTLSLGIGLVGIVVPGLPTTPFLLLTAGLYMRSSDKLYQVVLSNKFLGSYMTSYQATKGISLANKVYSIGMMWVMIFISCFVFIHNWWIKALILLAGIVGSVIVGVFVKTKTV